MSSATAGSSGGAVATCNGGGGVTGGGCSGCTATCNGGGGACGGAATAGAGGS